MLFFCLGGLEDCMERKTYFPTNAELDTYMSIKYKGHICVSNMQNINWMKSREKRLLQTTEAI
jgi:hypothetical protein